MQILTLKAKNVKAIKAIRMKLDGTLTVIGGKNRQGKSAVLDAVEMALAGGKAIPEEPIRRGEKSGSVELALSNGVTVVRTFNSKTGHKLKLVETATGKPATDGDGKAITQVQSYLNPLLGNLAFDPLEFSRMAPKDQLETLKRITGLDFAEIDKRRAQAFAERTNVKRDAKNLEGQLSGMRVIENPPCAKVLVSELSVELSEAMAHNQLEENVENEICRNGSEMDGWREDIAKLEERIRMAETKRDTLIERKATLGRIHIDPIKAKIHGAESTNADFRDAGARSRVEENLMAMGMQIDELTESIKAADDEKAAMLEAATLPIDGLAFGDDGVTFNDIEFSEIAASEKIKVSTAIGFAGHPELNLVRIDGGEALDLESLATIGEMAEKAGAQVIMARVSTGPECSVIIEDGEIADQGEG